MSRAGNHRSQAYRWLWLLVLPAAALLLAATLWAMAGRLAYPYDLEWMEGGQLAHAWRLQHGRPIYPAPGPDWIPYIYPPGYSMILAALGSVVELGAPLGRAVSVVGTALAMVGIVCIVGRQGRGPDRWLAGVAAALVYLGCWRAGGAFLDLVRPDALAVGLLLVSVALSLEKRSWLQVIGGLALAGAFWVKQPMAAWGVPLVVGLIARDRSLWAAMRVGLSAAVPAGLAVLWTQWSTDGAFLTYLLGVPASHPIIGQRLFADPAWEWMTTLPFALALIGVGTAVAAVKRLSGGSGGRRWVLWVGFGVTAILVSFWMRGHLGGFVNVLIPLFAFTAIGAGLMSASLSRSRVGTALVTLAFTGQLGLAWVTLDAGSLVPSIEDERAGDRIVQILQERQGPVFSPISPWLAVQAGHEPGPHLIAIWDVANHPDGPWPESKAVFRQAIEERHWAVIVEGRRTMGLGIRGHYESDAAFVLGSRFRPKTGYNNRPAGLWVPKTVRP
ncbi:MAG: hypothetical protein AB8H79_13850 [Myxococcota bacterium]